MTKEGMQKYFFSPKSLEEIIESATIVVDTNVLLSAYQWKEAAFKEVLKELNKAAETDRLRIPMHVFEEFMNQRPKLIQSAIERINTDKSKIQKSHKLSSTIPLLSLLPEHDEYISIEEEYLKSYQSYRKILDELSSKLKGFFQKDPVLDALKSVFESACFTTIDKHDKTLIEEAKIRLEKKQPPLCGGDAGKKENKFGDYFIWKDILTLNNDVIFVSTDFKEDWYYLDGNKQPISPRRELIEEYYESNKGKTCYIVSLADYMKAAVPTASEEVISELIDNQSMNNTIGDGKEQFFELKYRAYTDDGYKKLVKDMYSYLYFDYDVKIIAHSNHPLLDLYTNRYEYIYIKLGGLDRRLIASDLLENFQQDSKNSTAYKLVDITEVQKEDSSDFTYLNGQSIEFLVKNGYLE